MGNIEGWQWQMARHIAGGVVGHCNGHEEQHKIAYFVVVGWESAQHTSKMHIILQINALIHNSKSARTLSNIVCVQASLLLVSAIHGSLDSFGS